MTFFLFFYFLVLLSISPFVGSLPSSLSVPLPSSLPFPLPSPLPVPPAFSFARSPCLPLCPFPRLPPTPQFLLHCITIWSLYFKPLPVYADFVLITSDFPFSFSFLVSAPFASSFS